MWCIKSTIFSIIIVASLIKQFMCTNALLDSLQQQRQQHARQTLMLKKLLKRIGQEEAAYETCAILKGPVEGYNIEEILQKDLHKTVMLHENVIHLTKFSTIAWWHEETNAEDFIKYLGNVLNLKRQTPVLVIKQAEENSLKADDLLNFFNLSKSFKLPNLITIFKDFYVTRHVYQFEMFPQVKVLKKDLKFTNFSLFPNKLRNLYGHPLRSMPDQSLPGTAVQFDEQGRIQIKGYIINFLNLFVHYLNATLVYPMKIIPGKVLIYKDLYYLTQNNFIDLPAGLVSFLYINSTQLMSHFLEVNKWCLMIPIEKPFSYRTYITKHVNPTLYIYYQIGVYVFAILLVCSTKVWSLHHRKRLYTMRLNDILVNPNVCAGMIGSSFKILPKPSKSLRLIYISLFVCGLMFSIIVSSQLQSFLTHPYANRIKTLRDVKKSNLKILVAQTEFDTIMRYYKVNPNRVPDIFKVTKDCEEYAKIQASFNTSYIYPTISPLWFIYNAFQTYRNKPIFRLSPICYQLTGIMSFVLPANFLFTEPLNSLIMRVRDMGLLEFWLKISFFDFVKMGKIYMSDDRNIVAKSNMLNLEDFQYIWISMSYCFGLALIVFVAEVVWFSLSKKFQKLNEIKM